MAVNSVDSGVDKLDLNVLYAPVIRVKVSIIFSSIFLLFLIASLISILFFTIILQYFSYKYVIFYAYS